MTTTTVIDDNHDNDYDNDGKDGTSKDSDDNHDYDKMAYELPQAWDGIFTAYFILRYAPACPRGRGMRAIRSRTTSGQTCRSRRSGTRHLAVLK